MHGDDLDVITQGELGQVRLPAKAHADEAQSHLLVAGLIECLQAARHQTEAEDREGGVTDEGAAIGMHVELRMLGGISAKGQP